MLGVACRPPWAVSCQLLTMGVVLSGSSPHPTLAATMRAPPPSATLPVSSTSTPRMASVTEGARAATERAQVDVDFAVATLLIQPLLAVAQAGGRATLLVDALDEAQDGPSKNDVVRMLQLLGKSVTAGLGVVVTMRPDPEVNIRILKHAWGAEHAMEVAPTQLRGEAVAAGIF